MQATANSNRATARCESGCRSVGGSRPVRGWALAATSVCLFSLAAWGHDKQGGCGGRGKVHWATPDAKARIDFSPKHGGISVAAPNGYHHLEAVYVRPRLLKIYLYDPFGHPIQAAYFAGAVVFRGETGQSPTPLRIADDGTLEASLPPRVFPLILDARISYGGPIGGPKAFEKLFTFGFDRISAFPEGPPAELTDGR